MNPKFRKFVIPALVLLSMQIASAENRDSVSYAITKDRILELAGYPAEYEGYIEAADELAAKGLFETANELLIDMFSQMLGFEEEADTGMILRDDSAVLSNVRTDTRAPAEQNKKPGHVKMRLSSSISYDKYDYSTLLSDTSDSMMDSLDETDDRPVNGNARVTLDLKTGKNGVRIVSPFIYGSNSRIRAGILAGGEPLNGFVVYDVGITAEKRLFEDYGDSSDEVSLDAEIEATSRPLGKTVSVSLPVRFEAEKYRKETEQYPSYLEISGGPGIGFTAGDFTKSIDLCFEGEYRRYSETGALDNMYGYGPSIKADLMSGPVSGFSEVFLKWERFSRRKDPSFNREAGLDLQLYIKISDAVSASLTGNGLWQSERYEGQYISFDNSGYTGSIDSIDTTDLNFIEEMPYYELASYNLDGYGGTARPSLRIAGNPGFFVQAELGAEWYGYPLMTSFEGRKLVDTISLSESYKALEPCAGAGFETERIRASLSCGFRVEDVKYETYSGDCRSVKPAFEFALDITESITIDSRVDLSHRMYAAGKDEDDVSAYLGVSSRF